MQRRRLQFIKVLLDDVFKEKPKRPTIAIKINKTKESRRKGSLRKDCYGHQMDEKVLSSNLCTNKNRARLAELMWYRDNMKLYTVYPEQKVDASNWLIFPYGNLFPLYINTRNFNRISSQSDVHILVEVDIETYGSKASATSAKLEDYGLIVAWTILSKNISFILKTDIEHFTNLISGIIQGQYYINNGLFLTRVQSVSVSGDPRIYNDSGHIGPPPNKDSFYALCDAALAEVFQDKSKDGARVRGMSVQDKNLDTEFTDEFLAEIKKDTESKSNSAPATCASSPNKEHITLAENTINRNCLPEDVIFANAQGTFIDYDNLHLPKVTEKKDNTNDEESKNIDQNEPTTVTDSKNSTSEKKDRNKMMKPPNVLVCADSIEGTDNLRNLLLKVLEEDRYDIHKFSKENYERCKFWIDEVSLVVLCGNVSAELGAHLVDYIIGGGKLLTLCSDMLHILLPSFKTAEVRENELVHFSYGKWKRVRMMHHIFCYHASPIRTRFSQDHEDTKTSALNPPTSTNVKDKRGNLHSFDVQVLGREETWQSPSILLATLPSSDGKMVFSQIHLEVDPMQYVYEGEKFDVLKKSNTARLEIIKDLLSTHLGLYVNRGSSLVQYSPGFFLGKFEMKMKMVEKLKDRMGENNVLRVSKMQVQFCTNNVKDIELPSDEFLPIIMHMCPLNFSTVDYFENLYTKELGRLVIYADTLTSSMNVVNTRLQHGLVVIPQQQTNGQGRRSNNWLSPKGCAMFTLQIHVSIESNIGPHVSILQHVMAVALISAVRSIKGYEDIDLRIKWPNDVYVGNSVKIGGIIVSTLVEDGGAMFVCNIGAGINLSNNKPTICINEAILQYNQKHGTKLKPFSYEKYFALVFNEMEILLDILQSGNVDHFYQLYYKYWLHTNAEVMVTFMNGRREKVTILGIDNYGYLIVEGQKGMFTVHSDGNSFDVFKGLIVPRQR